MPPADTPPPSVVTHEDMEAACAFRDSLVPRADGRACGRYPWWHGWVIVEAYLAGLAAGRKEQRDR